MKKIVLKDAYEELLNAVCKVKTKIVAQMFVVGEKYAESECINPVRVITTTVRAKDGRVIAVKTDNPVPKDKMFECMDEINKLEPDAKDGLGVGDILCTNLLGTGANVVVTQKVSAL